MLWSNSLTCNVTKGIFLHDIHECLLCLSKSTLDNGHFCACDRSHAEAGCYSGRAGGIFFKYGRNPYAVVTKTDIMNIKSEKMG